MRNTSFLAWEREIASVFCEPVRISVNPAGEVESHHILYPLESCHGHNEERRAHREIYRHAHIRSAISLVDRATQSDFDAAIGRQMEPTD